MNWEEHVEKLKKGETVSLRPKGNSMEPKISSGNLVTVEPLKGPFKKGDIVFCRVGRKYYVHMVQVAQEKMGGWRYQIGNNKNHTNGTIGADNVFGKVTKVEP